MLYVIDPPIGPPQKSPPEKGPTDYMMILPSELPLAFYHFSKIDIEEASPGFMITEMDIMEDEDIAID